MKISAIYRALTVGQLPWFLQGILLFEPHYNFMKEGLSYYPYVTEEEAEAQRGQGVTHW